MSERNSVNKGINPKTTSILSEICSHVPERSRQQVIDSRAEHVIASASNLIVALQEQYSPEDSSVLIKKVINCIKNGDPTAFKRALMKVHQNEQSGNGKDFN